MSDELKAAVLSGEEPIFDPHTGIHHEDGVDPTAAHSVGARAGLEPPRFCQLCGRRMIVQVRPDGWRASCSRHGELDSDALFELKLRARLLGGH